MALLEAADLNLTLSNFGLAISYCKLVCKKPSQLFTPGFKVSNAVLPEWHNITNLFNIISVSQGLASLSATIDTG